MLGFFILEGESLNMRRSFSISFLPFSLYTYNLVNFCSASLSSCILSLCFWNCFGISLGVSKSQKLTFFAFLFFVVLRIENEVSLEGLFEVVEPDTGGSLSFL